jgi:sugar phosphate permease
MDDFGWKRAEISGAFSLGRLEGGIEGPLGGYLTDKYGPRAVNFWGIVLAGSGLCLMYFMNSFWSFVLIWGLMVSTGFNLGMIGPLETAISNWFVKRRGIAHSLSRAGLGLGGAVIPPFMTMLLIQYGWRSAFLIAGFITWAIGLPLTWFFVKPHRPEYYGLLPDGGKTSSKSVDISSILEAGQAYASEVKELEFTLRQALRTPTFWILSISWVFRGMVWPAVVVHQIPYLTDMGLDPVTAAAALGFMVLMSIPGRLFGGIVVDRLDIKHLKYLLLFSYVLQAIGLFILLSATNMGLIYLFDVIYGFGMGISAGSTTLVRARYFGRKAFSTIHGTMTLIRVPSSVIAPIYAGWVYDLTGSYAEAFTLILVLLAFATVMLIFANPPKPPERITGITEIF